MTIARDHILEIIAAGIRAPSADNSEPWKFKILEDGIEVWLDAERVGMFFDAGLSATSMSLGAVSENMALQAQKIGYQPKVELNDGWRENGGPVFRLRLLAGAVGAEPMADGIFSRATDRRLYRSASKIDPTALAAISEAVMPVQGSRVVWIDAPQDRKRVEQAAFLADLVRFTHPIIHRDFHEKLRIGRDSRNAEDGLAAETLGVEKPLLPVLKLLRPWGLTRLLNLIGLHYIMAWRGCWLPMRRSSKLGLIIAPANVDYFDWGRVMERVWLAATVSGLSFQPLGALPLLLIRQRDLAGEGYSQHHKQLLERADAAWRGVDGLRADDRMVMLFRVGNANGQPPRSRRRQIDTFLIN